MKFLKWLVFSVSSWKKKIFNHPQGFGTSAIPGGSSIGWSRDRGVRGAVGRQCHGNHNGRTLIPNIPGRQHRLQDFQVAVGELAKFASLWCCESDLLLCIETSESVYEIKSGWGYVQFKRGRGDKKKAKNEWNVIFEVCGVFSSLCFLVFTFTLVSPNFSMNSSSSTFSQCYATVAKQYRSSFFPSLPSDLRANHLQTIFRSIEDNLFQPLGSDRT